MFRKGDVAGIKGLGWGTSIGHDEFRKSSSPYGWRVVCVCMCVHAQAHVAVCVRACVHKRIHGHAHTCVHHAHACV